METVLAWIVLLLAGAAILLMIAAGIETGLRARYEEREKLLKQNMRQIANRMYMDTLSRTRICINARMTVVEDELHPIKTVDRTR